MNAAELAEHVGVTYRQIDYWIRAGYITPKDGPGGTGHHRQFSWPQVRQVEWMARLVQAGLSVSAAARVARGDKQARAAALTALSDGWLEESA